MSGLTNQFRFSYCLVRTVRQFSTPIIQVFRDFEISDQYELP